jgi:hypothetical protein
LSKACQTSFLNLENETPIPKPLVTDRQPSLALHENIASSSSRHTVNAARAVYLAGSRVPSHLRITSTPAAGFFLKVIEPIALVTLGPELYRYSENELGFTLDWR